MKSAIYSLTLALILLLYGCVEYHPYDTHIHGQRHINSTNIARIEQQCAERREIRFAVVSDSQRWYDELEDAVEEICERDDIDFVIHAGDITDWGLRSEFEMQRDILNGLDVPYVCLLGNHDCLGTGREIFREIFGEFDFAFTAGNVRFVCLNTNALEFKENEAVPNIDFVQAEAAAVLSGVDKTVVAMHAYPRSDQLSGDKADALHAEMGALRNLQFCLHGHGHRYREEDIYHDGLIYYECSNAGSEELLIFTITEDGYECERVFY